jgi:hypothetical protein
MTSASVRSAPHEESRTRRPNVTHEERLEILGAFVEIQRDESALSTRGYM